MSIQNKNFALNERVVIHNTGEEMDGRTGEILGKSSFGIVDFYIVLLDDPTPSHRAVNVPEGCLDYTA